MEQDVRSAQKPRNTRDVVTYLYGVVQHMQNTYDNGARVSNVALNPKMMKLRKSGQFHCVPRPQKPLEST